MVIKRQVLLRNGDLVYRLYLEHAFYHAETTDWVNNLICH